MTFSLGGSLALSALVAMLATALCAFPAKPISRRLGIVDRPHGRKIHSDPIPYLGGAAMFFGLCAGLATFAWLTPHYVFIARAEFLGLALGATATCALGLWDDVRGAKALPKILVEVAIAVFMWNQGLRVERITLPFGGVLELSGAGLGPEEMANWRWLVAHALSLSITIGWYVLLMNAVNLIDGLDGLASGIAGVAALVVVATALTLYIQPPVPALVVGLLTAALCLGFLFHNWHPATIFMGDAGALLLGFLLATTALLSSTKAPALLTLLVPLLAVGLPIFESVHSFLRRLINRQNPFQADRRHLHHRLLDLGLSHRQVVATLVYFTAFLGLMAYILATASPFILLFAVAVLGFGLLMLLEIVGALERSRSGPGARDAQGAPRDRGGQS